MEDPFTVDKITCQVAHLQPNMAIISCIAFEKLYVRLWRMYHLDWWKVITRGKYQVRCQIYTQNCFVIRFFSSPTSHA